MPTSYAPHSSQPPPTYPGRVLHPGPLNLSSLAALMLKPAPLPVPAAPSNQPVHHPPPSSSSRPFPFRPLPFPRPARSFPFIFSRNLLGAPPGLLPA